MVAVFTPYRTGEWFLNSASSGFSVVTCSKKRIGGTYFSLPQPMSRSWRLFGFIK
jgi:hypothetical protein